MWETGLRRSTLWKLRVPDHYHRGSRSLNVTREIDKSRFARVIPLSARAVATLEDVAPELGLVFGKHDLRDALRSAARKAGLPSSKSNHLSNHDFRHSAITYWASRTTNLAGVQYLAGHRHAATTGRYVNAGYENARAVLEALAE